MLLSINESQELQQCENIIESGLETFYAVGVALLTIRDKKLFKQEYSSFEEYCRDRWNISQRYAYNLIAASLVVDNLASTETPPPVSERLARPLSKLETEQQKEVWKRALDTAPTGYPTAGHIQKIVEEIKMEVEAREALETNSMVQEDLPRFSSDELSLNSEYMNDEIAPIELHDQSFPTTNGIDKAKVDKKPMHTANVPIGTQFHNKLLWNYKRIDMIQFDAFTIGYSQRSVEQMIELLQIAKVEVLIDARRNAISQYKPDFNKNMLETFCLDADIQYQHVPELGIVSSERSDLHETHDYDSLWINYDETVEEKMILNFIMNARVAFLCVELDPNTCHRHRIAQIIETKGYKTFDL